MNAPRPFTDIGQDDLVDFLDPFTNVQVIRRVALSPLWTDLLDALDPIELEGLISAYQVIASEAANILAMKEWLQDPLYRQAAGLKDD